MTNDPLVTGWPIIAIKGLPDDVLYVSHRTRRHLIRAFNNLEPRDFLTVYEPESGETSITYEQIRRLYREHHKREME